MLNLYLKGKMAKQILQIIKIGLPLFCNSEKENISEYIENHKNQSKDV